MAELDSDTVKKVGYVYKGIKCDVEIILFIVHLAPNSVVSQTPPSTHSDPPVPSVDLSNIPDDGTLGESLVTQLVISLVSL